MDSSDDDFVQGGALDRCLKRVVRDDDPWSVKRTLRGEMTFKRRGDMNSRITREPSEQETLSPALARGFWVSLPGATNGTLLERVAGVLGVRQERYKLVSTTYTVSGITSTVNAAANVGDWFDVWTLRPADGLHINASKQTVSEGDYAIPLMLPSGITYPQVRTRLRAVQAHGGIGSLIGPAEVTYGAVSVIPDLPYPRYSTPNATGDAHYVFASAGFRLRQSTNEVELSGAKLSFMQFGGGVGNEITDDVTGVFGAYVSVAVLTVDPYVQLGAQSLYSSGLGSLVSVAADNHATSSSPISIPVSDLDMGTYVTLSSVSSTNLAFFDVANPNLKDCAVDVDFDVGSDLNYDTVIHRPLGTDWTVDDSGANSAAAPESYAVATIDGATVTFASSASGSYTLHTEESLGNEWYVYCDATPYDPKDWVINGEVNISPSSTLPSETANTYTFYSRDSGGTLSQSDYPNYSSTPWSLSGTRQKRFAGDYSRRTLSSDSNIETTMNGDVVYRVTFAFDYDRKELVGTKFFIDENTGDPISLASIQAHGDGRYYHRGVNFTHSVAGSPTVYALGAQFLADLSSATLGWSYLFFSKTLDSAAQSTSTVTGGPSLSIFTRDYIYYDAAEAVFISFVTEATTTEYSARYEVDFRGNLFTFAFADRSILPLNYDYVDWIYAAAENVEDNVPYVTDSGALPIFSPNYCEQGTCPFIAYTTLAEEAAGVQPEFLLDMPMTPTLYTGYVNPGRVQSACIFVPHQAIKAFRKYIGNVDEFGVLRNNTYVMRDLFQEQKRLQVSLSASGAWANALGVSAYSDALTTINIGRT